VNSRRARVLSTRLNAGALIVECFYARPLQRQIGGTFGLSLVPGR
jgi:hypothetical protein